MNHGIAFYSLIFTALLLFCNDNIDIPDNPSPVELISPVAYSDIYAFGSIYGTPDASYEDGELLPHNGIDISALEGTTYIASAPGIVREIRESRDNWGPVLEIEVSYNREFAVIYVFEPIGEALVKKGDSVRAGDPIGKIGRRTVPGAIIGQSVHFGVKQNGEWVCPVPYFNPEARRTLNILRQEKMREQGEEHVLQDYPNLCTCPEHKGLFE